MDTEPTNYFVYAVPAFILLMLVEAATGILRRRPTYGLNDTFTNLACGMGSQLTGVYLTALSLAIYGVAYDHLRLFDLPTDSAWTWALAILGVDFIYYVWHRLSHTVNFLWATHVVHHQSEEYNLSVALRQSWFGNAFSWFFYLPLAILGVPPLLYLLSGSINLLYQFVIHTKAVKTLGPLDWVLNTPSHHRVHHGSNIEYLDKNYAGMLIIWDRLFGSFAPEEAPVEYGLVKPLRSYNPVWANIHYWVELAQESRRVTGWRNKLLVWLKNPGWQPGDRGLEDARDRARGRVYEKFARPARTADAAYVLVQFLAAVGGTVAVMALGNEMSTAHLAFICGALISGLALWNGLLAGHSGTRRAELVRLTVVLCAALAILPGTSPAWALPLVVAIVLVSLGVLAVSGGYRLAGSVTA